MFLPPFFVLCHAPYPFLRRGVLTLLLRRISSPVMGIQLSRCFFGFVTVFSIDNLQPPC